MYFSRRIAELWFGWGSRHTGCQGTSLRRKLARAALDFIVLGHSPFQIVGVANVEFASWILQHVDPELECTARHAPRKEPSSKQCARERFPYLVGCIRLAEFES